MSWKTEVRLFNNVPFSSNYQDTRYFDNKAQQDAYFNGLNPTILTTDGKYINVMKGEVLLSGYADMQDDYNYIIIENKSTLSNSPKKYFCFIKGVEYNSTGGTRFEIEVDVLQTYMLNMSFKKSFVERAHMPRWKSNGKPIVNVAPEDLNMGSEYHTVNTVRFNRDIDNYFETIIVTASDTLNFKYPKTPTRSGLQSGIATAMTNYMILLPKEPQRNLSLNWRLRINNDKYMYRWSEGGGAGYNQGVFKALELITAAGDSETFANRIVNVTYLPFFPYDATVNRTQSGNNVDYNVNIDNNIFDVQNLVTTDYHALWIKPHAARRIGNAISTNIYDILKTHYASLGLRESKLLMYPFSQATLYDNLGNTFEIKPQYTVDGLVQVDALTSMSAAPKAAYIVKNYAGSSDLSNGIVSNVDADITVLNDHSATYMQGKKNSDSAAMAAGNRAGLIGSVGGAATAIAGVGATAAGALTLNPLLLGAGIAGMASSLNQQHTNTQSILARQEDMQNVPASVSGQVGATNLVIGYELILPRIEIKTMGVDNAKIVNNFLHTYGVAVKDLITVPLKTRTNFNFIKTSGANITGNIPTNALTNIKKIFDNGITLWHTNDMYNYDVSNNER